MLKVDLIQFNIQSVGNEFYPSNCALLLPVKDGIPNKEQLRKAISQVHNAESFLEIFDLWKYGDSRADQEIKVAGVLVGKCSWGAQYGNVPNLFLEGLDKSDTTEIMAASDLLEENGMKKTADLLRQFLKST